MVIRPLIILMIYVQNYLYWNNRWLVGATPPRSTLNMNSLEQLWTASQHHNEDVITVQEGDLNMVEATVEIVEYIPPITKVDVEDIMGETIIHTLRRKKVAIYVGTLPSLWINHCVLNYINEEMNRNPTSMVTDEDVKRVVF